MKRIFLLLLVVSGFYSFGQKSTQKVEPFTKIDVFGPFYVELIKSDKEVVEMDYRNMDSDDIISEVSRGELRLKLRSRHYMSDWTSNDYPKSSYVKVKVYYLNLDDIEAQAGAEVFSGQVVKSKNLALESSMGAEVRLDILAKNLYTKVSMGGIMDLEGKTEGHEVKASMGGVLKASQLESKTAYVNANMGAEVDIRATGEIEVSAGFGAVVNYSGSPNVRHTSKNFGGEVRGH